MASHWFPHPVGHPWYEYIIIYIYIYIIYIIIFYRSLSSPQLPGPHRLWGIGGNWPSPEGAAYLMVDVGSPMLLSPSIPHACICTIYIYERELILASKICIGHCKSCLPRYTMNPIVGTIHSFIHSLKRNGPCWHFGPPAFVGICTPITVLSATLQSVRAWNVHRMCNQKKAWWCWFGRPRTHHGQVVIPSLVATSSQINAGDCPSTMAGRADAGVILRKLI